MEYGHSVQFTDHIVTILLSLLEKKDDDIFELEEGTSARY